MTAFLIRAFEEIQWMREEQISFSASFDASVYAWNHGAVHTLKEEQAAFITAPWELNSRELEPVFEACRREGLPAELIVYGRAHDGIGPVHYKDRKRLQ